jgi:Ca2+-binding RTX toxin-like protein
VNDYTNTTLTDGNAVVLGGAGVDTITLTATDSGVNTANVVIQSGGGADDVTLSLAGEDETADLDLGDGDDTLTIGNATSAGDTLVVDGGAGTDSVDLAGFDISLGSLTFANVEVIDDSDGAGVVDAALLTGESYTIKGDGNIATLLDVTVGTAGSYDFSDLVLDATLADGIGGLNITGNAGNDTIVGTDGADTIATGGGDDNITGGQGADDITLGAGTDTVVIAQGDTGITATTIDSIAAFATTTDKLKLGTAATATNYVELADADYALDFSATKTAADAALDGTVKYVFAGDTDAAATTSAVPTGFLFIDYDMDGTSDAAVELVGLQAGTFEMGDIIA